MCPERLTRRECLTRGAGAILAAGTATATGYILSDASGAVGRPRASLAEPRRLKNYFATVDLPPSSPRISVAIAGAAVPDAAVRTPPDAGAAPVERLVRAVVAGLDPALGMKRFVGAGDIVLIKPNVGFDRPPHLGATTNPEVVRWIARLCREAGARQILIVDHPIESPEACFAKSGIARVAAEEGARVLPPAQGDFQVLTIRDARVATGTAPGAGRDELRSPAAKKVTAAASAGLPDRWPVVFEPLARATKLIGVAPVKDHNLCSASMVLKNWYGLLGGRRNQLHQAIHEVIGDLAALISPTLVIADATRVMMRNGPTGGRLSDVRPGGELGRAALIASVDPVACDAWCYEELLGRDPAQLTYLTLAHEKIQAQVALGQRRFAECDWHTYERQGGIVSTGM